MSIIKSKHSSNYTVIPNEVFELKIPLDSIGLLCYLLSMPSDWITKRSQLANRFGFGREKVSRILDDLVSCGYVSITKNRQEDGSFTYDYEVYDKPNVNNPGTGQPDTGQPSTVNPTYTKYIDIQSTNSTKTLEVSLKNIESVSMFDEFWRAYQYGVGKAKAKEKFIKLSQEEMKSAIEAAPAYVKSTKLPTDDPSDKRYNRAHAATWLNQRRWEDEIIEPKKTMSQTEALKDVVSGMVNRDNLEQF